MGLRKKQHYHDYAELTALMEQWAESSPLCSLSSIGECTLFFLCCSVLLPVMRAALAPAPAPAPAPAAAPALALAPASASAPVLWLTRGRPDMRRSDPRTLARTGTSQEGRELWLMTMTDASTGSHDTKPAFWCEANTHAGEITGTEAALHLIDTLVTAHEADEADEDGTGPISQLFKTSTVYVLPRITPDGAELFLKTPHSVRSSPIMYPGWDDLPGLKPMDLTGDGEQLVMRIPDSAGGYKCAAEDPRVMVLREVDDYDPDETYYRKLHKQPHHRSFSRMPRTACLCLLGLLPEGMFEGYDGETQNGRPNNFDLNRQFPSNFSPGGPMNFSGDGDGGGPPGAGPYPLYLPEGQYVMKAISSRNNIVSMLTYHTTGRILIQVRIHHF